MISNLSFSYYIWGVKSWSPSWCYCFQCLMWWCRDFKWLQWNLYNFGNFIASIINFKLSPKTKIYYALAVFGFQSLTRLINHSCQILWARFKQENLECFKSANWTLEWISNNYQTLTLMLYNAFLNCFQKEYGMEICQ